MVREQYSGMRPEGGPDRVMAMVFRVLRASLAGFTAWTLLAFERPAITPEQWAADIQFLGRELPKRHKNAFFKTSQAEFEAERRRVEALARTATELEIRAGMVRLVASIGDVHTWIEGFSETRFYPFGFRVFPDGIYVSVAAPAHSEAIGARLVAINGIPTGEVQRRLMEYFPRENRASEMAMLSQWITQEEALAAVRVTRGGSAGFALEREGKTW